MEVTCRIDTRNFMAAHKILHRYAKNPAESLHKAVFFVVDDAKRRTPAVAPETIVQELALIVTPAIGKRDKPMSFRNPKNWRYLAVHGGSGKRNPIREKFPDVPLAWLIIGARAKETSRYNLLTSNRYAIAGGHPFEGHKVSEFAEIMMNYVTRMVKARRSSTHFLQSSWNAIITRMSPYVPASYRLKVTKAAGKSGAINMDLGSFTPAKENDANARCVIENRIGMDERFPALERRRNEAAHRILGPALQNSIDRNFMTQIRQIRGKGLKDYAGELAALGVYLGTGF